MTDHPPTIEPGELTLASIRDGQLRGRPVTVLGLARSGIALARFLHDAGARVTVYDGRPAADIEPGIAALGGRDVELRLGPSVDPAATWSDAVLVTTSPSINPDYPTTEPRLRQALRALATARISGDRAAPAVVSEADLFLRLCPAPVIGVTGTKGKTTTASLIRHLLDGDPGHPAVLGGNIGTPLIERLPELTTEHRVVLELSELQLPTLSTGTTVAVYTNVTSDHLDRHGSLDAYRRAKRRLAELIDPSGALVLNADDPVVAAYASEARARTVLYTLDPPPPGGIGVVDGRIVDAGIAALADAGTTRAETRPIIAVAELPLPGRHNVSNALAAIAAARLFGLPADRIGHDIRDFRGVEHRLERIATIDGVVFVNDSMGTQPDAVIAALEAFEPPIVLIAGGRDKGLDLAPLARVVADRAAAAVLIGESAAMLERRFRDAGLATIERAETLEGGVVRADALARRALASGDGERATVLLSPAAASFDMFEDYAARGRAFRTAVERLAADRPGAEGRES